MASMQEQNWDLESGDCILKETSSSSQTPSSSILSTSFLRRRPNQERPPVGMFKQFLNNLRLVFLGTKLTLCPHSSHPFGHSRSVLWFHDKSKLGYV
ncbi:unnamed protein product [Coffea canephora]|uniref:Uncharacterized protein n=1 Tax=Coffea canephora TaxID=49390 RepID=A0A068VDE7_COFCA|nr:unnamed protein product [Coffea canephora]